MKSYKKIMPIFLVALLVLTVFYSVQSKAGVQSAYRNALTLARDYAEKGIVTDAISQYETAYELNPTVELLLEAGEVYLENGDYNSAVKWYSNELLANYPKEAETYLYGITVYLDLENYRSAYEVYDEYQGRGLSLAAVEEAIDTIKYEYDLKGSFTDVSPFSNSTGTAAVEYNDAWGYVDTDGEKEISYRFTEAGVFGTYAAVVTTDGEAMFIDADGNEKINEAFILESDPDFGQVEKFQSIQSNMILAYNGEVWNYYDAETYKKIMGDFAGAYPVTNGVGAVQDSAGLWALISSEGKLLTDYCYDEVVADEKGFICRTDAIIVQLDGDYILVDHNGNQIGDATYEAACGFNDSTYAAVQKDGSWIFVDPSGNEIALGEYDGAKSFSNGYAAVQQDDLWGFIDMNGELVISCSFYDAGSFYSTGVAFVKAEEETWKLLSLYSCNH